MKGEKNVDIKETAGVIKDIAESISIIYFLSKAIKEDSKEKENNQKDDN